MYLHAWAGGQSRRNDYTLVVFFFFNNFFFFFLLFVFCLRPYMREGCPFGFYKASSRGSQCKIQFLGGCQEEGCS